MPEIDALFERHLGQPGVVIGGGPSLIDQVITLPADAVRIGVNDHGHKALEAGLIDRLDYCVYLDKAVGAKLAGRGVPIISSFPDVADYVFARGSDVWQPGFTSGTAAWLALYMGCDPVILAGMDCYTGPTYFHDAEAKSSGSWQPVNRHLANWNLAHCHCPHAERIRTAGGPTEKVFPRWT